MRKLLSLLLALTMLASTMSVAFAAPADVTDEDQMEAVEVLMALGVVDGYPDGTYRPDNTVTRAEMAKLIVTILGYENIATAGATSFTDMGSHWARGYVEVCVGLGIVKGYTDGSFKPDAVVSYNEAATMIIRALGYTDEALGGTWPTNYVTKAMDKDIFDDIASLAGGADRGDIAIMLFNALPLNIGTVDQDGDYNEEDGDTLIGRVDGEEVKNTVIIGDEDTLINLRPFIGRHADVYTYDGDIILVMEDKDVLEGDYTEADEELEDANDKTWTLKDDVDADEDDDVSIKMFDNGDYIGTEDDMDAVGDIVDGVFSVNTSGVTVKEVYAINVWEVTADLIFDADDDADDIADEKLGGVDFELNDDEEILENSYWLQGVDSLDDIEEDDVVYVYEGADEFARRIAVGQETVEGEITKVNSAGTKYTIDGTVYELADASHRGTIDSVDAEADVEIKLDYFGYIYEMKESESEKNFAIILEWGNGSGSGLTKQDAKIKLFLEDGSDETFVADGADLDGQTVATMSDEVTWDTGVVSEGDLVEYALNDDGEIDELYILAGVGDVVTEDVTSRGYYDSNDFASACVAFAFDGSDVGDEDNYSVIDFETLYGTDNVVGYYSLDGNDIEAIVVRDYDAADDVFALVHDYASIASDNFELTTYVEGEKTMYDTEDMASVAAYVGTGELYMIDFNAAGEVTDLVLVEDDDDADTTAVRITSTGALTVSVDGDELTISGTDYTIDADAYIYELETDDDIDAGKDLDDLEDSGTTTVHLFDVVDGDGVYDTVVYVQP